MFPVARPHHIIRAVILIIKVTVTMPLIAGVLNTCKALLEAFARILPSSRSLGMSQRSREQFETLPRSSDLQSEGSDPDVQLQSSRPASLDLLLPSSQSPRALARGHGPGRWVHFKHSQRSGLESSLVASVPSGKSVLSLWDILSTLST